MQAFLIAFAATLFAEMGDKTQLVTLTLATRHPPLRVLAGSLSALAAITGLAVLLGEYLAQLFPQKWTMLASGLFFIVVGIFLLLQREEAENTEVSNTGRGIALQTFLMVLAELGDKTQLTAIALTAAYSSPTAVFLGAMAGQTVNHSLAAYLGARFLSRLPDRAIKVGSALLFILFGAIFLYTALR